MSAIFLKTLNLAISTSWLIVAVILVRLLLKKTPRWIFCLLWGLVALRLICPFSLESALSLIPSSEAIPADITMDRRPQINSGVRVIDNAVNPVIERNFAPSIENSVNPMQVVVYVASIIWIIGLVVMSIYALVSYVSLRKRVRASVMVYDNVMQCDEVRSPFILGMLRPVIYVPSDMTEKTLELVLAHENAHIKRLDHWWKPLGFALLSVYWFNPLCWVAYILLCRDIEMACDEKVICDKGREYVVAYSQALLDCSIKRRYIAACPLAFGETGVKERIKSVLNYRKPAFWIVIAALIGCVALTICFLTDPIKKSYVQAETVREDAEGAETAGKEAERAEAVRQEAERAEAVRQETEKTETGVENYSAYPWEKPLGYDNAIAMVKRASSAFSPTVNLQDMEGADLTEILYSDKDRIIFSGYYGLFVYSKKERTVTNGIDLEAIGCQYTQGDSYCEKRVSDDGKKVYLHPVNLDKMYIWNITTTTDTLIVCPYDFENIKFHERSTEWNEDYNPGDYDCWSGNDHFYMTLLHHGGLIGELCYADVITDIDSNVQWYPLFSQLGGLAGVVDFEPGDIHDISEADIWIAGILPPELGLEEGRGYRLHCDNPKILSEIEAILSNAVEDKTMAKCPFYTALYLTRDDGVVGTVFPATDSCTIYQSGGVTYGFGEGSNEKLWKLIAQFELIEEHVLIPYDTEKTGAYAGYFFIPIGNEIYRYEGADKTYSHVTATDLIFECTESGITEDYEHYIYGLAEYPNLEVLMDVCKDSDGNTLHEVFLKCSPAMGASQEEIDRAMDSGYVIMENGSVIRGKELWLDFYDKAISGERASVRIVYMYTMDRKTCSDELYEATKNDYPALFLEEIVFDGDEYTCSPLHYDGSEYTYQYIHGYDDPLSTWKYLMHFTGESSSSGASYSEYDRYVLVNDDTVVWEDLQRGMLSSRLGDYIPYKEVFCEYTWK